jgi:hypothetical protein
VYYFPVPEGADGAVRIEAGDGFVLLGDNVPLSIDSRHWKQPGVLPAKLIGVVQDEEAARLQSRSDY